jgi:hypothetical protein
MSCEQNSFAKEEETGEGLRLPFEGKKIPAHLTWPKVVLLCSGMEGELKTYCFHEWGQRKKVIFGVTTSENNIFDLQTPAQ